MAQAVHVTVLGMALVFLALIVVMVVTIVLDRLFRVQPASMTARAADSDVQTPKEEAERVAAVIGAVLAVLAQEAGGEVPGIRPDSVLHVKQGTPGWKAAGRFGAMQ